MPPTCVALRRITIDTKHVCEFDGEEGLYWVPDELDVTRGWAIICGEEGTPYYGGAYCFEVQFPDSYPFEPPKFTFLTQDGRTRFNPNLYKNGKVCLSILNTWRGEPWSGVQSLGSVMRCIQTAVLTGEPLYNEPAYPAASVVGDLSTYNRLVLHANLETAILDQLTSPPPYLVPVLEFVVDRVRAALPRLRDTLSDFAVTWDGRTESLDFYKMSQRYRFGELAASLVAHFH
jgi:ubiquitin-conjugating enzyme E2 Z